MNRLIVVKNIGKKCEEKLRETGATRIGLQETFEWSSILFYLVGMAFGCSYSLVEVNCIDWVKTSLLKRLMRATLGCVISAGLYFAFQLIDIDDQHLTEYLLTMVLPFMIIPFFIYGPFLIICQKIGLVDQFDYD